MPVDPSLLPHKYNELIDRLVNPTPTCFSFQVDGVLFTIRTKSKEGTLGITMLAELGFFPYTEESSARRYLLSTIINNVTLPIGKLTLGNKGQVYIAGEIVPLPNEAAQDVFSRFLLAICRSHPFFQIIGALF